MQKEHMDCIRSNMVYLGRTLEVNDDLLMSLINSNIFTMDHMEEMQVNTISMLLTVLNIVRDFEIKSTVDKCYLSAGV